MMPRRPPCLLIVLLLLLQTTVSSGAYITQEDVDAFDKSALLDKVIFGDDDGDSTVGARSFVRGTQNNSTNKSTRLFLGQRCNDEQRVCNNNLFCSQNRPFIGRRCFPSAQACFSDLARSSDATLDFDEWKQHVFDIAGISEQDLGRAALLSGGFQAFQDSSIFLALQEAFISYPPTDSLRRLQQGARRCLQPMTNSDNIDSKNPATTITYLGLQVELSGGFDFAVALFWAFDDLNQLMPNIFIRLSLGGEFGIGVEVPGLLGVAFTSDPNQIAGEALYVDADAAFGLGAGMSFVFGNNGVPSIEFTFGPGIGAGLGIGYSITEVLVTTPAPTGPPTTAPASN